MLTGDKAGYYIELSFKIIQWSLISASIIGLIGNPFAAFIYLNKVFQNQSFRVYYPVVLISGTIPLVIGSSTYWAHFLFTPNSIYCKIIIYFNNVTPIFASWMLAILSIDSAFYLFYPNKFNFLRKYKFQLGIILVSYTISSALVIQLVVLITPDPLITSVMNCVYYAPNYYDLRIYFTVYFLLYAIVPFIVMIATSILMIKKLESINKNANRTGTKKRRRFARTILGSNLYFIASILPYCIVNISVLIIQYVFVVIPLDIFAYMSLANSIANIILYIYYSTQIIIHVFCNRLFRQRLSDTFRCYWQII